MSKIENNKFDGMPEDILSTSINALSSIQAKRKLWPVDRKK